MEFTPCPVFHQPQQPRLHQDYFVQQHHDYQFQTVQYCLTQQQQQYNYNPVQQQHQPQVAVYHQQQQQLSGVHGCQMGSARFLDRKSLALWASGLWLRYATLQNLIKFCHLATLQV